MGWLRKIREWGRRKRRSVQQAADSAPAHSRFRTCRFEQMESRQLLSVASPAINVGAVYFEDHDERDTQPDTFQISWNGGAPGTRLTELTIDTDKTGDGLTIGDVFFDPARESGKPGAYGFAPLTVVSRSGIDSVQATLSDDRTTLTFHFQGFDPGEQLIFTVDVDEMGFLGANAVAEGNEFEGSRLYASFDAPGYYPASGNDMFIDFYDGKLAGTGLSLPPDSYVPPSNTAQPVYTAGAIFPLQQQPLPASISGHVFVDANGDGARQSSEPLLPNVELHLLNASGRDRKSVV